VASVFFLPALLLGRRASCHTLCWIAPFLIAGRSVRNFLAWPALRLDGRPQLCRRCGSCTAACPMSIEVQESLQVGGLETTDCILCGSCADACQNGALHLGFGKGRGFPARRGRLARALPILLLLALAAPGLRAESLLPLPASLGGMGGPHFKLTWFAGQRAMLGGGPAYLIVDGRLYLGLNGSYLEGNTDEFMIGYGGPSAGWLLFPDSRFNLWLGATAALGGMRDPAAGASGVFVLEPEAIAQVALGPYSRLGLGVSYRWALPFEEVPGYGARELSGPSIVARVAYGVFRPAAGEANSAPRAPAEPIAPQAPSRSRSPRAPRVGLVGTWSQKFSLVRGQLTRFDGGYTRLILKERWGLGAMGYRTPGGAKLGANDFQMVESGVWVERFFDPSRRFSFSIGALTGIALVGYITPAEELVGSPAFLFNPEALGYLNLSDFVCLSASLGYRTALPLRPVPGLEYWDCNGPTLSLNLVFGVF
jgi:NAD-dependent dihydropyrimidine dehydrogenase PreA subunit